MSHALDPYNAVLQADPGELDLPIALDADLPEPLIGGAWWSNGPAGIGRYGRRVHPFDGHGYVRKLSLTGRRTARLQARFVETDCYRAERAAGRITHTGIGTLPDGGWRARLRAPRGRNVANTTLVPWRGGMLALWEGGRPHALDPDTLATRGEADLGGLLAPNTAFLAHTRWDPVRRLRVGCVQRFKGLALELELVALREDETVAHRATLVTRGFSVMHDFAITPRFYVILEGAVDVSLPGVLADKLGWSPILNALRMADRPAAVWLVPREGGGEAARIELDRPLLAVHHVNAWEEGGQVVLVTCGLSAFGFGHEFGWIDADHDLRPLHGWKVDQDLVEIRVDPTARQATTRVVAPAGIDFPAVAEPDGARSRRVVGTVVRHGSRPFCGLAAVDLTDGATLRWLAPPDVFVGEPLIVGDHVTAMLYDGAAGTSTWAAFDLHDLPAGPRARVPIPHLLPFGFHGCWTAPGARL